LNVSASTYGISKGVTGSEGAGGKLVKDPGFAMATKLRRIMKRKGKGSIKKYVVLQESSCVSMLERAAAAAEEGGVISSRNDEG
jgi:hypothetical protein